MRIKRIELVLGLVLFIALVAVYFPRKLYGGSLQSRRINNAKQILTACALFASDKGAGQYPKGRFSAETDEISDEPPADSAEECFQDLFRWGILKEEDYLFWGYRFERQCSKERPNGDGTLEAGENSWDYVAGMANVNGSKPLLFDASDSGKGRKWTWREGGYPWVTSVVVGYADGASCRKETLDSEGKVKKQPVVDRVKFDPIDLCVPIPGKNGWPEGAMISPATPFVANWVGSGDPPFSYKPGLVRTIVAMVGKALLWIGVSCWS